LAITLKFAQAYGLAGQLGSLLRRTGLRKSAPITPEMHVQRVAKKLRRSGRRGIGDPFRVFLLPLSELPHFISNRAFGASIPLFGLRDGDWDRLSEPIENLPLYRMCKQHFLNEVPWEKTAEYKGFAQRTGRKNTTEEELKATDEYMQYMDRLHTSIRDAGFKPQTLLMPSDDMFDRRPSFLNEVQIFVGRQGACMVKTGIHRVILAKLLGLSSIPVRTRIRHTDWQAIRDELCRVRDVRKVRPELKRYLDHPEIQDVLHHSLPRAKALSGKAANST